ncbi:MAG: type II secretion system F family protein [Candidatus Woesearchaeota archaeon]
MKLFDRIFFGLSNLGPSFYKQNFRQVLLYAAEEKRYSYWGGMAIFLGILSTVVLLALHYQITNTFFRTIVLLLGAFSLVIIPFLFFLRFSMISNRRANDVSKALPNALSLIAANLRAGMTPFQAVKLAAIPEFGVLGEEFKIATSRSQSTYGFVYYLEEMNTRVNSPALHRTMRLFVTSIRSGGRTAELLDRLSKDISDRNELKAQMLSNVKTNAMFIMFIIIIGTPVLMAVSIYFVDTVTDIQQNSSFGTTSSLGGFGGAITITSQFIAYVSYIVLFITCISASLFLGTITDGDPKQGLRLAPILLILSYAVFFIARFLTAFFLGG